MEGTTNAVRKRKQGENVQLKEKQTILDALFKILENEKSSISSAIKKVSGLFGISERTIFRIKKEHDTGVLKIPSKTRKVSKPYCNARKFKYNECYISVLRQTVHQFYRDNLPPTLNAVLTRMNENEELPKISRSTLHLLLHENGFVFESRGKNSLLLERDDIICWRHNYLREIKKARSEKYKIIYTDESWVNIGIASPKVWKTVENTHQAFNEGLTTGLKTPTSCGPRFALVHAGGEDGFIPNAALAFMSEKNTADDHDDMDCETYEKWFIENLLPNCPQRSLIVMDNAKYHSRQVEAIPTASWTKDTIKEWLASRNIQFEDDFLKIELLNLVKEQKLTNQKYNVDEKAKEAGIRVLRLPPYHCELNPIEMVWGQVKQFIRANNTTFKSCEVKDLLTKAYDQVTPQNWSNYIKHVKKIEDQMWESDCLQDDVDELFIRLTASSANSSPSNTSPTHINSETGTSTSGLQTIEGLHPLEIFYSDTE